MIGATGLVLMMTIPGLALFYAGMVRKKNVLATMAQSLAATFLVSILWALVGYSLAFTGDGVFIGTLERIFLGALSASPELPGGVHGLLEGNPQQMLAQLYGVAITLVWLGAVTFVILKVISALVPLRVRQEDEIMGLDVSLHGEALQ
jgi:ammonia channel protein AmtB